MNDWELHQVEKLSELIVKEQRKLHSLLEILAMLHLHAEHTPDGWLVIDERVEQALELPRP